MSARTLTTLVLGAGVAASPALAQQPAGVDCTAHWKPERAITILIPRSPAAGAHGFSAAVAKMIEEQQGVEVRLENRLLGDRTGRAAVTWYTSLPGDGYAVLQNNDDLVSLSRTSRFGPDPLEMLAPVAMMQVTYSQIYTRPERYASFEELLEASKSETGITIAHSGNDPSLETFQLDMLGAYGLCSRRRPFESKSERYVELLTDGVDAVIDQPGDVRELTEQRLIKPIISLWNGKPPGTAPDVGDLSALMEPGLETAATLLRLRGYFVHADTPPERRAFLECAFEQAYFSDAVSALNERAFMDTGNPDLYAQSFFDAERSAVELERLGRYLDSGRLTSQCP